MAVQADLADEGAVTTLFDTTEQHFGRVDVVNADGIMILCRADPSRRRDRHLLHIGDPAQPALLLGMRASKAAVEEIRPVLAKELHGRDVTVNTVARGPQVVNLCKRAKLGTDRITRHT